MNNSLFANPQLFQAYQNDPGMAYGQALMQQGASTAPVRSPLEGLARALTAGVGGFTQSKVHDKFNAQNESYRKGLAAALQSGNVLEALQGSEDPQLAQMGLQAKLQQAMQPADRALVQVYDPVTKTMVYKPQSEAAGLQAKAPDPIKAPERSVIQRGGMDVTQQFNPQTGQFEDVSSGPHFAPQQPQETWQVVNDAEGKPAYLESSTGNQKALPGKEGAANVKPPSAADLRDEYSKGLKDYVSAVSGYNKVVAAAKDTSPAGDIAMIFGFMKTLDPTSTVREGEFATAQNAGSVPTQIQSLYNKIISGERLTPQQRTEFITTAKGQLGTYEERKSMADKFYSDLAARNGIKPEDVLVPYPAPSAYSGAGAVIDLDSNGNPVSP